MNFEQLFSGSALQTKANQSKDVKSMKDGIGKLVTVEAYTSKRNGSICAKLSFQDMSAPNNPNRGHDEYLSTREGARFLRVIEKLKYLPKIAKSNCMENLPSFFNPILGENNQPVTFTTNDELTSYIDQYGSETTFFWLKDVQPFVEPQNTPEKTYSKEEIQELRTNHNKQRVLVSWNDRQAYINAFIQAFNTLVGTDYKLKFSDNEDNDFRSLKKVLPATI